MRQLTILEKEEGQRFFKYLEKYMPKAPRSFFYKMLRKKNITLNKKKADGSEIIQKGDEIFLFLSDDTIRSFGGTTDCGQKEDTSISATLSDMKLSDMNLSDTKLAVQSAKVFSLPVIFENNDLLFINKPAGILSQPDHSNSPSVVTAISRIIPSSAGFRPGICNRLDRNTSGIIACGKSISGLQSLNSAFADHLLGKYYVCVAEGEILKPARKRCWLAKDRKNNVSRILHKKTDKASAIETAWYPIVSGGDGQKYTFLLVRLFTGKSHQIRAVLSDEGHPLAGDKKYGAVTSDRRHRGHLLHCIALVLPDHICTSYSIGSSLIYADIPEAFFPYLRRMKIDPDTVEERIRAMIQKEIL